MPKPVRGKTELGVYIFPGWYRDKGRGDYPYRTHDEDSEWRAVAKKPKPRPLLGFYDDSMPEVNDWHILWALEHGITWFAFDWYWNAGEHRLLRTLERGFLPAKYSPMMKFCIHWCNHGLDWKDDAPGWGALMGLRDVGVRNGNLCGTATGIDPAYACALELEAGDYTHLAIRMRVSAPGAAQLFWTHGAPVPVERDSVRFATVADGEFHEYAVDLRQSETWQGKIRRLRFDPSAGPADTRFEIDYIRFQRGADTTDGARAWEFHDGNDLDSRKSALDFGTPALLEMTHYLADRYFGLPNYLTVDGRPVLMVWDTAALFKAHGGPEGFRQALAGMNAVLRARGMGDLYLVSMGRVRAEKDAGFAAMTGYGYYGTDFDSPWEWRGGHSVPYADVISHYETIWSMFRRSAHLPYFPPIGSSWDSRPRHSDRAAVVSDYTPDSFRRMCQASLKHIGEPANLAIIEAWNEWGEGSFIEPDQTHRFGFLDVLRETFTDAPPQHIDHMPTAERIAAYSVLGPEDLARAKANESLPYPDPPRLPRSVQWRVDEPLPAATILRAWEFDGPTAEGWTLLRLGEPKVENGVLVATVSEDDPQMIVEGLDLPVAELGAIALRLRVSEDCGSCEIFWTTEKEPELSARKAFRVALVRDGQWHTYRIEKKVEGLWSGTLGTLRFDIGRPGDRIEVDWIRLLGKPAE